MTGPERRALLHGVRWGRVIVGVFAVGLAAVGGGYVWLNRAFDQPKDPSGQAESIKFEVPKGATLTKIGRLLEKQGVIEDQRIWRLYLRMHPTAPSAKAGKHQISASMNLQEILEALSAKPLSEDVPVTMVEGWRLVDADAFLTKKELIEAGAYMKAAAQPEKFNVPFSLPAGTRDLAGYLLPDTYMVPPGPLDVDRLIQRQIDAFHARFVMAYKDEIQKGRPMRDVIIMASMLEREEPNPKMRSKVAGVLYKRLDAGHPLGVDATSRFNLDDWNNRRKFLKKLRDPKDPYNTRLKAGLPPGPIGAPGIDSLVAALRPKSSPYWYYLHDAQKRIHFARTGEEHEANRKKYNVW